MLGAKRPERKRRSARGVRPNSHRAALGAERPSALRGALEATCLRDFEFAHTCKNKVDGVLSVVSSLNVVFVLPAKPRGRSGRRAGIDPADSMGLD